MWEYGFVFDVECSGSVSARGCEEAWKSRVRVKVRVTSVEPLY